MVTDQDREEQTPLHLAVEDGDIKLAKLCLDKGANVNAHKVNMSTPLHLAATGGDLEIVKMLIEHDANIEAKNASQETPLHRAAQFNRVDIVEFLLNRYTVNHWQQGWRSVGALTFTNVFLGRLSIIC